MSDSGNERVAAPNARRLVAIDALRGVAVLAVLTSHLAFSAALRPSAGGASSASVLPPWLDHALHFGQYGVHLFLVLSGFCIHMQWARLPEGHGGVDFVAFWRRRLHRLYPPYFVALLASVLGLYLLHGVLGGAGPGIAAKLGYASTAQLAVDLALLLLLLQNLNGASHRVGNGPFWSLALEEQLYMLYFPLLALRRRFGWGRSLVAVALVTVLWRVATVTVAPLAWRGPLLLVGPARWLEWTLGALAVEAHMGKVSLPRWTSRAVVFVAFAGLAVLAEESAVPALAPAVDVLYGLAFFVLVNATCRAAWGEGARRFGSGGLFAAVGTISYSLYLIHLPIMVAVKQVGLRLGLGVGAVLALRVVVPIAAAALFYRLVESRFLSKSRARPSAAVPATVA